MVEVVSFRPRGVRRERIDKVKDYAHAGVRLYVLVDPGLRTLDVLELDTKSRKYVTAVGASTGRVRVPGAPGLGLDLDAMWSEVEAAEKASARRPRKKRP